MFGLDITIVAIFALAALSTAGLAYGVLFSRIETERQGREAVTREMQYLQKQGIVRQQGREMTIGDVARLAEIVRAASGDVGVVQRAGLAVGQG